MVANQCPQCGSVLPPNTSVCPNCGAPQVSVGQPYQQPQYQQPQYQQPNPYQQPQGGGSGTKILIGLLGALLLLLIGGAVFYFVTQNQKNEKEVAELKEQLEKNAETSAESAAEAVETQAPKEIIVKEGAVNAGAHHSVSAGTKNATTQGAGGPVKVVINGTGVRLRFAPSLNAGWLTWPNGQTRSVSKGTRLTYLGEDGDWYTVSYMGETFYVSKEYAYKVIPN